jgi:hypothetical protein
MKGHGEPGLERRVFVSVHFQTRLGSCDETGSERGCTPSKQRQEFVCRKEKIDAGGIEFGVRLIEPGCDTRPDHLSAVRSEFADSAILTF